MSQEENSTVFVPLDDVLETVTRVFSERGCSIGEAQRVASRLAERIDIDERCSDLLEAKNAEIFQSQLPGAAPGNGMSCWARTSTYLVAA